MELLMNDLMSIYGMLYIVAGIDVKKDKNNRVPNKRTLIDGGDAIVYSHIDEHNLIYVFENGYVLYQTDLISNMVRTTVFPLKSIEFVYNFISIEDNSLYTKKVIDEFEMRNMSPNEIISAWGTERILNGIERQKSKLDITELSNHDQEIINDSTDILDTIIIEEETKDLLQLLNSSIDKLTDKQKEVIYCRYRLSHTQEETANILHTTRSNIQKHEQAALQNLRKEFAKAGYDVK